MMQYAYLQKPLAPPPNALKLVANPIVHLDRFTKALLNAVVVGFLSLSSSSNAYTFKPCTSDSV